MARRIFRILYGHRGIDINIGGHYKFRMSPDFIFRGWERFGDRHNWAFGKCIEACIGKSVFIDVGAHVGLYSLPASRVMAPGGKIFAFEASANNFNYLTQHIQYNGIKNIFPYQVAIGSTNQDSVIFYEDRTPSSALSSFAKGPKFDESMYEKMVVRQITLDQFCTDHLISPDVVKIDVEGAELLVLMGSLNILRQHKPTIFLSVHPTHLEALGQSTEELNATLKLLGYIPYEKDGNPATTLKSGEYICSTETGNGVSVTQTKAGHI